MSDILFRPATAADRPAVVAFTQHTWPGGDYIREVYDAWLTDPRGPLLVGEDAGEVIAVAKMTFLSPREAWLEGLRVHPDHRGRGVASQFLVHQVDLAHARGAEVVRLATHSQNTPVHKMMAREGFPHVASFTPLEASPETGPVCSRVLSEKDADAAWALIAASETVRVSAGLCDVSWQWKELHQTEVTLAIRAGNGLGWYAQESGALAGVALLVTDYYEKEAMRVSWVGGDLTEMTAFAQDLRRMATERGSARVFVMLPGQAELRAAFVASGYKAENDSEGDPPFELFIFAKRLTSG